MKAEPLILRACCHLFVFKAKKPVLLDRGSFSSLAGRLDGTDQPPIRPNRVSDLNNRPSDRDSGRVYCGDGNPVDHDDYHRPSSPGGVRSSDDPAHG